MRGQAADAEEVVPAEDTPTAVVMVTTPLVVVAIATPLEGDLTEEAPAEEIPGMADQTADFRNLG